LAAGAAAVIVGLTRIRNIWFRAMNLLSDANVVYSAVLRPHRSLGAGGIRIVVILVAIASAIPGTLFLALGAWPVLPFLGLDVVILYAALRWNLRAGNAFEAINLSRRALTVRQANAWGRQTETSFQPQWLQVNIEELAADDNRLELRSRGRSLVIGRFLPPHERVELAQALRRELFKLTRA
jgi:uncharacterized membrane protein